MRPGLATILPPQLRQAIRHLAPCPWGLARNLPELKQDLGAGVPGDRARGVKERPFPPLPLGLEWPLRVRLLTVACRMSCSGTTAALSLAEEGIKQLSRFCCFRVSLLS